MRTNWVLTTALVAVSVTAAVGARSAKDMHPPSKGGTMGVTYTGCVTTFNHGAVFLLTRIDSGGKETMQRDETMTRHDEMAMTHEETPAAGEKMDAMSAKSFVLSGSTNLSKHVGQRVSVTGSLSEGSTGMMRQDVSTLTVKTLKVIAKSCS